jgi:hypothetical protein
VCCWPLQALLTAYMPYLTIECTAELLLFKPTIGNVLGEQQQHQHWRPSSTPALWLLFLQVQLNSCAFIFLQPAINPATGLYSASGITHC